MAAWSAGAMEGSTPPTFAPAFGSHMVLPHGRPLIVEGRSRPRELLSLRVDGQLHALRSDAQGNWRVRIDGLRAGGPYTLSVTNAQGLGTTLSDVLAGELWLCSGQSNMEFQTAMSTDQPAAMMEGHSAIRLLGVAHQTALQPQRQFAEAPLWQVADEQNLRRFSAVCYFFARQRLADEGMPLGLVNASWGGSAIEAWISEQSLGRLAAFRRPVELLRQYRDNRRATELAFSRDWISWWRERYPSQPVWEQGVLDAVGEWQDAPLADWRTYADPRLKEFTGNLWFSAAFELTAAQAATGASVVLGRIDEVDTTWLNGRFVANTFGYGTRREYRLDSGMLQPGTNQFSVFVTNTYGAGGMTGPTGDVGLHLDDGQFIPLGTSWKYRIVPRQAGYPPRAPWESVAGVSGMFNAMIAPLRPLQPSGVIWYQGESNVEGAGAYGELLETLIRDWRGHFGAGLPFIVVQLPNHGEVTAGTGASGWATLRHAQQQVALADARVALVPTQDLGDDADIHPRNKYAVAVRTLQAARALGAGRTAQDGVVPVVASADATRIVLAFSPPLDPSAAAPEVAGFALCTPAPEPCTRAPATRRGSFVEIDRSALPEATRVRYCWSDGGTCALRSLSGLPVTSFELPLAGRRD